MSPRARIIALILTAQTVANVGPLGIPAIASLIRADLGLTLAQAGSFLSAYYIGPALVSLPAGTLVDRWGVKRMLVLGQIVIAVGLLAASTASSYVPFTLLLIGAGFGYGILNPTSTKAVIGWAPIAQRATLVGVKQVGLPLGGMLGAALLPALALAVGWRRAVVVSAAVIALGAVASLLVYHDPPDVPLPPVVPGSRGAVASVLTSRDLWLVSLATAIFAAMQTVWMSYLVLYLQGAVGLSLMAASRLLALAQLGGMTGRVLFGIVGIGWNGVQQTWMAELAGPRAAGTAVGLGLGVASAGVTLGPLAFGYVVQAVGGFHGPWLALAACMALALGGLFLVRERHRPW